MSYQRVSALIAPKGKLSGEDTHSKVNVGCRGKRGECWQSEKGMSCRGCARADAGVPAGARSPRVSLPEVGNADSILKTMRASLGLEEDHSGIGVSLAHTSVLSENQIANCGGSKEWPFFSHHSSPLHYVHMH